MTEMLHGRFTIQETEDHKWVIREWKETESQPENIEFDEVDGVYVGTTRKTWDTEEEAKDAIDEFLKLERFGTRWKLLKGGKTIFYPDGDTVRGRYEVVEKPGMTVHVGARFSGGRMSAHAYIELPEGKTWDDVAEWYAKWAIFWARFKDGSECERALKHDDQEAYKHPDSISVCAVDKNGHPNDERQLAHYGDRWR
jgi:hypothetical protein